MMEKIQNATEMMHKHKQKSKQITDIVGQRDPKREKVIEGHSPSLAPVQCSAVRMARDVGGGIEPTFSSTAYYYDRDWQKNFDSATEIEGASWRSGSSLLKGVHSQPRVSYYFPKGVGEYHFGERHPMKPHRLTLTNHLVLGYGLHKKMDLFDPRPATRDELETFHAQDYVDFLARVTPINLKQFTDILPKFNIGDDCPIFTDMWDYCTQYAGASLMAARKLVQGSTDIAINWTGGLHHAKKSEASGFCYVNDIVLAILELLRVHARVLYIDIDIHHGDGVQEAFYNSNRVLTVSFHKYSHDFFPGTGHVDEIGHSLGKYFSLNVPLQDGIDNESYVSLFKAVMEPTIYTFQPSAIVLQCGADSLGCDRLGCFNLTIAAHGGGGYTIKNVSRCWTYETAVLLDAHHTLPNTLPHTAYDDFFAPDWKLHPDLAAGRTRVDNLNSRKALEQIRVGILERLRFMHGAPSVAINEVPPGLAPWMKDEIEAIQERDPEASDDPHRNVTEWFENGLDREFDALVPFAASAPAIAGSNAPPPVTTTPGSIASVLTPGPIVNSMTGRERRQAAVSAAASIYGDSQQRDKDFFQAINNSRKTSGQAGGDKVSNTTPRQTSVSSSKPRSASTSAAGTAKKRRKASTKGVPSPSVTSVTPTVETKIVATPASEAAETGARPNLMQDVIEGQSKERDLNAV